GQPPGGPRHARDRRPVVRGDGEGHEVLQGDDHVAPVSRAKEHAEAPLGKFWGESRGRVVISDEKLMRYVDGELSPAECRDVERELAATPELQKKRDALLEMGNILRARYELAESEADPALEGLWERVRTGLPSAPALPTQPGLFARFRDWFETYRAHFV